MKSEQPYNFAVETIPQFLSRNRVLSRQIFVSLSTVLGSRSTDCKEYTFHIYSRYGWKREKVITWES
ncbi:hypothetical protein ABIE13_004821 [Ottowia thiooxydans]|uniref:Uncharacterized protein n=1 Tax=Ottowia thiooxydans TaxID=219182 RepID=A0ABV2QF73_9BURK